MAVFRVEKNANYSIMANYHFRDKSLSWKAKGILSNMLSLPEDWDYSLAGLTTLASDGLSATQSAIKELEEHGYLIRRPIRENGKISDWEYIIFEYPQAENQDVEIPLVENQQIENQTQLSTNQSSTKKSNIDIYNSEFDILWKMYPNKKGKPKALKAYIKARNNGVTFEEIKQGIEDYCRQIKAKETETEFIKHGSTWFNSEGWTDEYDFTPRNKPAPKQSAVYGSSKDEYATHAYTEEQLNAHLISFD